MKSQLSFLPSYPDGDANDIIIIGAGLAGLYCALKLAPHPVVVLTPLSLGEGASSAWAQAGLAMAKAQDDSIESHLADTINAGGGLVDEASAKIMVEASEQCVDDLINLGVEFNKDKNGNLILAREAAHSTNRIVGVEGDGAGRAIMETLIESVQRTPRIRVVEFCLGEQLMMQGNRVVGVVVRDEGGEGNNKIYMPAKAVVLASGGLGHLFKTTTNPREAKGIGIGMALRAGAIVSDMEFVQFHPTALDVDIDPAPLASEALRGHGAHLVDNSNKRIMKNIHPDLELAPRDIVARTIGIKIANGEGAFLDCRRHPGSQFQTGFPSIYAACQAAGFNPLADQLPIVPAAHYAMGGVVVDAVGRTSLDGLWACGEVACTGAHGANRLASNSLLEAAAFAAAIADDLKNLSERPNDIESPTPRIEAKKQITATRPLAELWQDLRTTMAKCFGVVREKNSMLEGLAKIVELENENQDENFTNSLLSAKLIAVSALSRLESRGAHFRSDYPNTDKNAVRSFLTLKQANEIAAKLLEVT